MGLFRPARTVTGPHGDYWELYVSKTALPEWREGNSGNVTLDERDPLDLVRLPLSVVAALWSLVVVPLVRVAVLLPVEVVRGRRSRAVRVEAVSTFPHREVLLWTTTDEAVERVLDEIVAGLAAGRIVQPSAAVYSGREG